MKKIIGILGIAVIAIAMFFSANNLSGSTKDNSLVSLISINNANAEDDDDGIFGTAIPGRCTRLVPAYVCACPNGAPLIEVPGTETHCMGSFGFCIPESCH